MSIRSANCTNCREYSSMNRNITRFGCWNVRTMSGREEELIDEMKRYGLKVLGVSEARM